MFRRAKSPKWDRAAAADIPTTVTTLAESRFWPLLIVAVSATIFAFDVETPLGIAGAVAYVVVVLMASLMRERRATLWVAIGVTALTIAGFFASRAVDELSEILINRGLSLFAIWVTALLLMRRREVELGREIAEERACVASITSTIDVARSIRDSLPQFAARLRRYVAFDEISVVLADETSTDIVNAVSFAVTNDGRTILSGPQLSTVPLGEFQSLRAPVAVANLTSLELQERFPEISASAALDKSDNLYSVVSAPIHSAQRALGTLHVVRRQPATFSAQDFRLIPEVAREMSNPLENAAFVRKETQLRAEAEMERGRLEALLQASSAGVMIIDALSNRAVTVNEEARRLLALSEDASHLLSDIEISVHFFDRDGTLRSHADAPIRRALQRGVATRDLELVIERPDHQRIPVVMSASPVADPEGRPSSAIVVFQDISRIKELDEVRDAFLSMMTHDLRGPVATIKGLAVSALQLIEIGSDDVHEMKDDLWAIVDEADNMRDMVGNLLDMSRLESGALKLEREETHLADIVADAARRATSSRLGARRTISTDVPTELPFVYVDPVLIGRVLDNLLSNALKYSQDTIFVTASYDRTRNQVITSVRDTGRGIPEERHGEIFERFVRFTGAGERNGAGSGLGLAICKAVLEAHGGEIGVTSMPGEGARFWFAVDALQIPAVAARLAPAGYASK